MKKNIWIINHHANDDYEDGGGRHYYFAKYLKRAGYEPVIFCSNAIHGKNSTSFPNDVLWQEHMVEGCGCPFVFIKGRPYIGNGKQRILCMFDFYFNMLKTAGEYIKNHSAPDVIYASSVHPLALAAGIKLAKRFGVKCICEVRDLWPETIVAHGVAGKYNPAVIMLRVLEKYLYKNADTLIFTMAGGADYICDRKWDSAHGGPVDLNKVYHINNGVDLEIFDYNKENCILEDSDLSDESHFRLVYCGSLRQGNDLDALIAAAPVLKSSCNDRLRILVYGDGNKKDELLKKCSDIGADNIIFKGKVAKKYVPNILSRADACYIDGMRNCNIGKYGMSQNKLFDDLASGIPIISPVEDKYDILIKNDCGLVVKNNTVEVTEAIELLMSSPELCADIGTRARKAGESYDFKVLTDKLIDIIETRC